MHLDTAIEPWLSGITDEQKAQGLVTLCFHGHGMSSIAFHGGPVTALGPRL
jgi:hypothetical protein